MIEARGHRPPLVLWLWATGLPWGVYTTIPGIFESIPAVMALALLGLFLWDAWRGQALLIPFELTWPGLCILALALFPGTPAFAETAWLVLVFFGAVHLARARKGPDGPARGPAWTLPLLEALGLSTGVWAVFQLWAWGMGTLMPTAHTFAMFPSLYGPAHFGAGLAVGAAGLLGAFSLASRGANRLLRLAGGMSTVFIAVSLGIFGVWLSTYALRWRPPEQILWGGALSMGMRLLAMWLYMRIAAKLLVRRPAAGTAGRAPFLGVLLVMGCYTLVAHLKPAAWQAALLGLAAATALPPTLRMPEDRPRPLWPVAAILLLVPLIIHNIAHIYPAHTQDPRNYAAAAQRDAAAGRWEVVEKRMSFIAGHWPEERTPAYWRSRAALARGALREAADAYSAAQTPAADGTKSMLPAPGSDELDILFAELRQRFSTQDNLPPHLAYERTLTFRGDAEGALELMRTQTPPASWEEAVLDSAPLASAVAFLLGDLSLTEPLLAWKEDELAGVLKRCGVRPVFVRAGKQPGGTFVFAAYTQGDSVHYGVSGADAEQGLVASGRIRRSKKAPPQEAGMRINWQVRAGGDEGGTVLLRSGSVVLTVFTRANGGAWTPGSQARAAIAADSTAVLLLVASD